MIFFSMGNMKLLDWNLKSNIDCDFLVRGLVEFGDSFYYGHLLSYSNCN